MKISYQFCTIYLIHISINSDNIKDNMRFSTTSSAALSTAATQEFNNIDSINIDHLSCRPRTVTNVGLDQIINTNFKNGRKSFQRQEMYRPPALWGEKDFDFQELSCDKECKTPGEEDHRTKCLRPFPVVTQGLAQNVFVVLQPLIGKLFYNEIKAVQDKIEARTSYDDAAKVFENIPFEKEQFKAQARKKDGKLSKRMVLYLLIRNQWTGFKQSLLAVNKLQRVLKCSGYRKFVSAEDFQTTLINNDIVQLKMPAVWINKLITNTTQTANMGFNQPKLFQALGLGQMEYFTTSSDKMVPLAQIEEEWNEKCKVVRDFMISLWAEARDIKCGDNGWTAPKGVEDPLAPSDDETR